MQETHLNLLASQRINCTHSFRSIGHAMLVTLPLSVSWGLKECRRTYPPGPWNMGAKPCTIRPVQMVQQSAILASHGRCSAAHPLRHGRWGHSSTHRQSRESARCLWLLLPNAGKGWSSCAKWNQKLALPDTPRPVWKKNHRVATNQIKIDKSTL